MRRQHLGGMTPEWLLDQAAALQTCSQSLGHVVPGSVCEERMDDLSQFVTGTSRIQPLHDAIKIGKAVNDGASNLGKLIAGVLGALGRERGRGRKRGFPLV